MKVKKKISYLKKKKPYCRVAKQTAESEKGVK